MFLGIPYYIWLMVALALIGLIVGAMFYFFFWWRLTPYHGIFWAHLKKIGASFVFDDNMHFDIITDRSSKVIFNETLKEAQDAEEDYTEAPAASIGKVSADFVFDPDKWTYPNSYQHKIIEDIAMKHNNLHPEDQVRTLMKFARYANEGRFDPDDIEQLRLTITVPWPRIKMMYRDREESSYYGYVMSLANIIREIEKNGLNGYWWVFMGFFGIIDLLLIVAHFMTRGSGVA